MSSSEHINKKRGEQVMGFYQQEFYEILVVVFVLLFLLATWVSEFYWHRKSEKKQN